MSEDDSSAVNVSVQDRANGTVDALQRGDLGGAYTAATGQLEAIDPETITLEGLTDAFRTGGGLDGLAAIAMQTGMDPQAVVDTFNMASNPTEGINNIFTTFYKKGEQQEDGSTDLVAGIEERVEGVTDTITQLRDISEQNGWGITGILNQILSFFSNFSLGSLFGGDNSEDNENEDEVTREDVEDEISNGPEADDTATVTTSSRKPGLDGAEVNAPFTGASTTPANTPEAPDTKPDPSLDAGV